MAPTSWAGRAGARGRADERDRVSAGAGCGERGICGPHHGANHLPGVLGTFDDERHDRTTSDEGHQTVVERLTRVLGVVPLRGGAVQGAKLTGDESKPAPFESTDDFADETAFDAVGLH